MGARPVSESAELSTTDATTKSTMSPTTTLSDTTTSQDTITSISESAELSTTDATTKSTMSPTTTLSDTTTSQDTITSKSAELSTTDATTKSTISPTTTSSDTTTSQDTITSKTAEFSTTDATSKPITSPTTTMSDTTTSQDNITSKSAELSTTDATSKPMTSPTTNMSDTTTSQEIPAFTCPSPPVDCEFGGSSYNFSDGRMDHASAVSACSEYGSHLVFIESQEEEDFIARHVEYPWNAGKTYYWIGLTGSSPSEGRWLDGSSLTYSNFESDSFDENEYCFRIKCQDEYCSWHDRDCSIRSRFICEKEVGI